MFGQYAMFKLELPVCVIYTYLLVVCVCAIALLFNPRQDLFPEG